MHASPISAVCLAVIAKIVDRKALIPHFPFLSMRYKPLCTMQIGQAMSATLTNALYTLSVMQWRDVCFVAAIRYTPGLIGLATALGLGMLGRALPLAWLAAVGVAVVSSLTPIPSQVCIGFEHVHSRYEISAHLLSSNTHAQAQLPIAGLKDLWPGRHCSQHDIVFLVTETFVEVSIC